jgi:mono/diheme cytochrome c family protein
VGSEPPFQGPRLPHRDANRRRLQARHRSDRLTIPIRALVFALLLLALGRPAFADDPGAEARGQYLFHAAGCASCHGGEGGAGAPAGGLGLDTPFGTFRAPNITPDPVYGIGRWSLGDFHRAMRSGIAPDGHYLFPVFPYTSFTNLTDQDIADLYAYLKTGPAVAKPNLPHAAKIPFGWRPLLVVWRSLYFHEGPLTPDPAKSADWNRGNYLIHAVAHCEECHTPRNALGAVDHTRAFAGNIGGPDGQNAPNITTDHATGIGDWSIDDIETLLKSGMTPDSDFIGSGMRAVVRGTSQLTDADRHAIAVYLKSVAPISTPQAKPAPAP